MPLWDSVSGNYAHLGNHLMFWYLDAKDEDAAEAAARWAFEVDSSVFATPKAESYAAYNLACFYGRVGQAEKALPLLRDSIQARPELVDLARKDPDLDRIRQDPEIVRLLEG
jgi:hypothetical protein